MTIDARKLRSLPSGPGVYLFRDAAGKILYVGKANSIRSRVRSYFARDPKRGIRLSELARRSTDTDTILVGSDAEALVLEANLIKEHRPRFNIQLRDDKRYPFVTVTVEEPFPQVFVTRKLDDSSARYFGPYTAVGPVRQALELVKRLHRIRSCRYDLPGEAPPRPCLDHHIGRCAAPCVGLQTEEEYREAVKGVLTILGGEIDGVRMRVEGEMEEAARALRFEAAARHRDVLRGLEAIAREQRMERVEGGSQDILGIARDGARAAAVVLRVRGGKLIGRESRTIRDLDGEPDSELLGVFATRFYLGRGREGVDELPREILLPFPFPERGVLGQVLSARAGRRVRVLVPRRGGKRRMTQLAATNARHFLEERLAEAEARPELADEVLYELQDRLALKVVPRLIACFDVSHTQGSELVASAVAFENAEPKRALYRHMRIRGEWSNDDYRSIAQAVERYLGRRIAEDEPLPELIVLDGGKGQLTAVEPVLRGLGAPEVGLVALAKRREELFVPGRREPVRLPRRDPALRLLQRTRNEAHRFARRYNLKLRKRRTIRTELATIPGIGPKRQRSLLRRFGSLRAVRRASTEEIAGIPGFSDTLAERVVTHLRGASGESAG
ncbi:MAG: excinuclease ABC subunit UvrC [Gammaproteobacteria bacterium]|nr:excinuclease ABC subunit UvrC [Gammaproteobacteria bacterium]MDE0247972.1 excinuclease ABC subunit UvrC [Gammaproteobacteria bacterium]